MPSIEWQITLDGTRHDLRVEHGYLLRRYKVTFDNHILETDVRIIEKGSAVLFDIKGHRCFLIITTKDLFQSNYDLVIDGYSVNTSEHVPLPAELNHNKGCLREVFDYVVWGFVFWIVDLIFGYVRRNYGQWFWGSVIIAVAVLVFYILYKYYKSKEAE